MSTVPDFSTCAQTGELDDLEGFTTTAERASVGQVLGLLAVMLAVPFTAGFCWAALQAWFL